jgi:tetratricopeptide (TPR) repeat protein
VEPAQGDRGPAIRGDCYQLLLVLADAVARPLPGQGPDERCDQARQALRILDRAARLGPPTRAYHQRRAHLLEQAGEPANAQKERERAAELPPSVTADHFLLGEEAYATGDFDRAVRHLDAVLGPQPNHFWAQYFLALCYLRTRHWAEAKAGLSACLSLQPDFVWAYLLRGYANGQLRRFEAAEADLQEALRHRPDEFAQYSLHVQRGVLAYLQGWLDDAAADFRRAVALKPDQYQAYVNLAKVYRDKGELDEAEWQLDLAIGAEPDQPALFRERALLHLKRGDAKRGDRDAALRDLEEAIDRAPPWTRSPGLAENHLQRAYLLYLRGEYGPALQDCVAALGAQPGYAAAFLLQGEVLLRQKDYNDALRAFEQYLKAPGRGRPVADAYHGAGLARAALGRYAEAAEDFTRALTTAPDSSPLHASRGWAYLQSGAVSLALRDFQEAVRLDRDNADAYSGRGHARVKLGRYREAAADAEEVRRRGREAGSRAEAERLLLGAARVFAQALERVQADAGLPARQARDLASRYQEGAVDALREALAALPDGRRRSQFWHDYVQGDRALNPIRQSTRFIELAAKYGPAAR